jgi:hypothetical protein
MGRRGDLFRRRHDFNSMMFAYNPASNPLNTNEWAFPLCECFHIAAFAFSIGTIALVDLRLFGMGLDNRSPAQMLRDTEIWTLLGLAVVIASGLAIFSSDPVLYLHNQPFRLKMVGLLLAIVFNYTIHRRTALANPLPRHGVLVASISIALWFSLVLAGVFIAFI